MRWTGAVLVAAGVAWPLLTMLQGRAWPQAEVFGWMPDPTALVTIGALLALPGLPRWTRATLAVLPLLSLALGAATRWLLAQ